MDSFHFVHFHLNGEKTGDGIEVFFDELITTPFDVVLLADFTAFLKQPVAIGTTRRSTVLLPEIKIPFSFVATHRSAAWLRVGDESGEILPLDAFLLSGLNAAADARLVARAQQMINNSLRATQYEPAFDLREESPRPLAAIVADLPAESNHLSALYHSCACTFAAAFFRVLGLV